MLATCTMADTVPNVTGVGNWVTQTLSVQSLSRVQSLRPHGLQHARLPCPSPIPRAYSNSCLSSQWCHPTTSSSVNPFSSCLQFFPASGSFSLSQFFAAGGQSIEVSASASVLPMNIQHWFPLELTVSISLHQFFGTQLSLWSNSHIH